jgi:hypothetical protein
MERINKMQPVVDNKKPRELPMSGKKEIERRRFRDKVERGNRLLLDRLGKALERKNIDNERKPIKFNSLEQGKKKLELARVTMENQLLLERIQVAQPMYDHNQWERDAEHREFYLKNMTEFPEMYVPHYPPMRKKFLKEQERKLAEQQAKNRPQQGSMASGGSGGGLSPKKSPAKQGSISPPSHEPRGGVMRPEPIAFDMSAPHIVPTKPHTHTLSSDGLTDFNAKGEHLLHGSHSQALYDSGHHYSSDGIEVVHHDEAKHGASGGWDEERFPLAKTKPGEYPAPYQGADSHGQGAAGIVGNMKQQMPIGFPDQGSM